MVLPALMQQVPPAILPVSNLHAFERFHMGIALLAFSGFFQGLSSLQRSAPIAVKPQRSKTYLRPVWATRQTACGSLASRAAPQPQCIQAVATPALRVLRVTESDQRVNGAGRMVISGRMADVCAELDRLAALEAAQVRI